MKDEYAKYYSEESFWEKLKNYAKAAGVKVVYAVLLLYYAMKDSSVNLRTKLYIAAALGYFILPTDAVADFLPVIGFTDDLGVLLFALKQVSSAITPAIKEFARNKIKEWFEQTDEKEMLELEEKISD
jgi:uncharacterized membrane protein YkvA (DUF1232 family)